MKHNLIFFIFILFIFSCSKNTNKLYNESSTQDSIKVDKSKSTIKEHDPSIPIKIYSNQIVQTSYTGNTYPSYFESAFSNSTFAEKRTDLDTITYSMKKINIGKIKIESGKIIACDPIVMHDAKPFNISFPTGNFAVELAIAMIPNNERVAYSRILFSNNDVVEWRFATRDGEPKIPINDSTLYCFGVDAAMAIYIDEKANIAFEESENTDWNKSFTSNRWLKNDFFGTIDNFDNHNYAAFTTGWGDGCYGSFIGIDKNGKICRLLTDYAILIWWKDYSEK